jgi:hypothetical protein
MPSSITTGSGWTVVDEVVDRHLDGFAGTQLAQVLCQQVEVEGVGVVEIVVQEIAVARPVDVAVVAVHLDQRDPRLADRFEDAAGDRRLAGAGAAGDAEEEGAVHHRGRIVRDCDRGAFQAPSPREAWFPWGPSPESGPTAPHTRP